MEIVYFDLQCKTNVPRCNVRKKLHQKTTDATTPNY